MPSATAVFQLSFVAIVPSGRICGGDEPAVPAADLALLGIDGGGWGRGFRVRGEPGREGPPFLGVVVAEHAADVGVVLGVAVAVAGEERALEVGDAGGSGREELRVPGRHGRRGWVFGWFRGKFEDGCRAGKGRARFRRRLQPCPGSSTIKKSSFFLVIPFSVSRILCMDEYSQLWLESWAGRELSWLKVKSRGASVSAFGHYCVAVWRAPLHPFSACKYVLKAYTPLTSRPSFRSMMHPRSQNSPCSPSHDIRAAQYGCCPVTSYFALSGIYLSRFLTPNNLAQVTFAPIAPPPALIYLGPFLPRSSHPLLSFGLLDEVD